MEESGEDEMVRKRKKGRMKGETNRWEGKRGGKREKRGGKDKEGKSLG